MPIYCNYYMTHGGTGGVNSVEIRYSNCTHTLQFIDERTLFSNYSWIGWIGDTSRAKQFSILEFWRKCTSGIVWIASELTPNSDSMTIRGSVGTPQTVCRWQHIESCIMAVAEDVLGVGEQRGPRNVPLVGGKEEDVGAGGVHLVRLPGMDGLLLHRLDLQGIQLLVKHLNTYAHSGVTHPCK